MLVAVDRILGARGWIIGNATHHLCVAPYKVYKAFTLSWLKVVLLQQEIP